MDEGIRKVDDKFADTPEAILLEWPPRVCGDTIGHLQEVIRMLKLIQKTPKTKYSSLELEMGSVEMARDKLSQCLKILRLF
jgi:hypothetical protein